MYLYFDNSGILKEIVDDTATRQGNGEVNKIYIYVDGITPRSEWITYENSDGTKSNELAITEQVIKSIPYDRYRDLKYFKDFEEYNFFVATIPSSVLSISGLTKASVRLALQDNSFLVLGLILFTIEESVVIIDSAITESEYQYLLSLISDVNVIRTQGVIGVNTEIINGNATSYDVGRIIVSSFNDRITIAVVEENEQGNNVYKLLGTTLVNVIDYNSSNPLLGGVEVARTQYRIPNSFADLRNNYKFAYYVDLGELIESGGALSELAKNNLHSYLDNGDNFYFICTYKNEKFYAYDLTYNEQNQRIYALLKPIFIGDVIDPLTFYRLIINLQNDTYSAIKTEEIQAKLVSNRNIKTINGNTILGGGNIDIPIFPTLIDLGVISESGEIDGEQRSNLLNNYNSEEKKIILAFNYLQVDYITTSYSVESIEENESDFIFNFYVRNENDELFVLSINSQLGTYTLTKKDIVSNNLLWLGTISGDRASVFQEILTQLYTTQGASKMAMFIYNNYLDDTLLIDGKGDKILVAVPSYARDNTFTILSQGRNYTVKNNEGKIEAEETKLTFNNLLNLGDINASGTIANDITSIANYPLVVCRVNEATTFFVQGNVVNTTYHFYNITKANDVFHIQVLSVESDKTYTLTDDRFLSVDEMGDYVKSNVANTFTALQTFTQGIKLNATTLTESDLERINTEIGKIDSKQDKLVSGTNIKTINGNTLLGSGDLKIDAGNTVIVDLGALGESGDSISGTTLTNFIDALNSDKAIILKAIISGLEFNLLTYYVDEDKQYIETYFVLADMDITLLLLFKLDINGTYDYTIQNLAKEDGIKTINNQSLIGDGDITINKSTLGLGNVDNTSDANKPISTATQNALNAKQNTLVSGTNIKSINNTSLLGSGNIDINSFIEVASNNDINSIGG